jgi:hypothetical protein
MGNLMAKKLSFIWLMLFVSFFSRGQNTKVVVSKSKVPTAIEEKILDTIFRLPECRERAAYIEKQTKGKRHLGIVIYERPSRENPYYWVKAREDNGMAYATHFNFYVYPKPFSIRYYDTVLDKATSLKEWRQQTKLKGNP